MFNKKEVQTATIEEIQDDFLLTSKNILDEAKKILDETGLSNRELVDLVENKKVVSPSVLKKYDSLLMRYYLKKYNKKYFLRFEETKAMCKKYSLMCASIRYYTGHIPENNAKEISEIQNETYHKSWKGIYVIAPKSMFTDNTGLSYEYIDTKGECHVPDPIVLMPVYRPNDWRDNPMGFVVITFWGKEGELL